MLSLRAREDLGATAMKVYSVFPLALLLLDITIRIFDIISRTLVVGEVLPICRNAVGVFWSPSQLSKTSLFTASLVAILATLRSEPMNKFSYVYANHW